MYTVSEKASKEYMESLAMVIALLEKGKESGKGITATECELAGSVLSASWTLLISRMGVQKGAGE